VDAEFCEDCGDVIFHGAMAYDELRRNLAIRFSRDDQANHVEFAGRERAGSACERCGSHTPTVPPQGE
jgi:hypothetical protein